MSSNCYSNPNPSSKNRKIEKKFENKIKIKREMKINRVYYLQL